MFSLIVGLGGLGSHPARAEVQNDAIGFSTNHVFESGDAGEHIDVMSGNVTLTIPLGPRYKLNESFGYGVTLYYNAKIWEHECNNLPRDACPGTLPPSDIYGLGFSLLPARVYHHANDKAFVFRIQLEDGSDHFFCDPSVSGYSTSFNCDAFTADTAHILVQEQTFSNPTRQGWKATMPDGRKFYFGQVVDTTTHEALATRIESAELRGDGTAAAWVAYSYSSYQLNDITDSHGRGIHFTYNGSTHEIWIDFPSFATSESSVPSTTARYVLHTATLTFKDPSDQSPNQTKQVLTKIDFPGLNASTESYQFAYQRTDWPTFGLLLQRRLPTGATIDYYYEGYSTSNFRPYHIELMHKTLTSGGVVYRWSWDRFGIGPTPSPLPPNPQHPPASAGFSGSNPYQVKVLDPFNNLTLYNFRYSTYISGTMPYCNGRDECKNTWSDGLLSDVSTYAGPDPDSTHLVRRVESDWDNDRNTDNTHKMFQYRAPSASPSPQDVHSMAVNTRQIEERTFSPGGGDSPGHTVKATHSVWSGVCSHKTDEYLDDVLYRSTIEDPNDYGRCDIPSYVEVRDAMNNVVSRVDNKYTSGRLECQVRRKGTNHRDYMSDCTTGTNGLNLVVGDVATINTFDPTTWVTTQTVVKGGDVSTTDSRTMTMTYLMNGTNEKTGYLKTKNFGFTWNAVDRVVDFNTGLTAQTHDPAGNTTRYTWDGLGRLTRIEPTLPEKPTVITYTSLLETHVRQDLESNNYVETVYFYDDPGRLITTKRRNAAGTFDVQKTEYDISGRVTRKSEWAPDGTAAANLKWTTYDYTIYTDPDAPPGTVSNHPDPLGRIHGVTTPDDLTPSTPTTETSYAGSVTTVTVRDIRGWGGSSGTTITSTTAYTKDALGRLVAVDSPDPGADAQYIYDEADNLTEVRLTDPATTAHVQVRRFDYDRLGRLRAASNPENGTVEYISYDARGNLLKSKDARQNIFAMAYDGADRLLTRNQTVGSSELLLAQNTYDTGVGFNSGGSAGHLVQQDSRKIDNGQSLLVSRVRFGYGAADSSVACPVTTGGYTGLNGRLSWQTSAIQPWNADLQTDYCQDALGMPTTIRYPDSTNSERTRTQVGPSYRNGYLLELHDDGRGVQYLKNVSYAAGGVPKEIDRVNNKDLIDLDVRNRPTRFQAINYPYTAPGGGGTWSISCEDAHETPEIFAALELGMCDTEGSRNGGWTESTIWDSGSYAYDMAGNVKTIGTEQYYYDAMSRLVHGSMPGVGATYDLAYVFDAFGNMTSQTRTSSDTSVSPVALTYTTDWQTNRLTAKVDSGSPSVGYTYDENGNMTTEGTRGFVFDGQGRLREVMEPQKGRIGNYDYDASGYRVRSEADGVETYLLRDGSGQVLSEFQRPLGGSAAPVWNKDYIYALGKSFALVKNQVPAPPKRPWVTLRAGYTDLNIALTLNWTPVNEPDILGYNLERRWKKDANTAESVINYSLPASPVSWNDGYAAATSATYVKYTLSAIDTAGNLSEPGLQLVVYPWSGTGNPNATASVTLTPGDKSMTIRWDVAAATHNDILGYYVDRAPTQTGSWTQLNTDLLTAREFLDTGLTNGQTYWYRIRTVDTANRISSPSTAVSAVPLDNIPPGKITEVFAEPDRPAHTVIVSWKRGVDLDVASYRVYRSTVAGTQGGQVATASAVSGQESYSITDSAADQGFTYYYSVAAVDTSSNVSTTSDQVSIRPRHGSVVVPVLQSATFEVYTNGATSTDGRSTGCRDCGNVTSEDDDVIRVKLQWAPTSDQSTGHTYRIYRKAPDEAHYMLVGSQSYVAGVNPYVYYDTTVTKGEYTYYVTGQKVVSSNWEESAAQAVTGTTDHAVSHYHSDVSVRNIVGIDARHAYATDNKESRYAYIEWSRVTEVELVGYNIYRLCNFQVCNDNPNGSSVMEHFACEPDWIRLNAAPIPPDQQFFEDSSTNGLQGCFLYAVRPVGPNRVEGPIDKIVTVNLSSGQYPFSGDNDAHAIAATYLYPDAPIDPIEYGLHSSTYTPPEVPIATVVNDINSKVRGTGDPSGPPVAPTAVTGTLYRKYAVPQFYSTRFAQISWTMNAPPSDLLGFHVETAGSPNGPWQRLTEHPVAWWERHYTAQAVGVERCSDISGHTQCLSYRVIAVDEAGNESPPALATTTNPSATTCPMTPDPPKNLRASNYPQQSGCSTLLEWDPSPGATEYYVYRFVSYAHHPYFYDTQRVVAPTTSFRVQSEWDDPALSCTDKFCAYGAYSYCAIGYLDAYYITARGASGGESPRSNLVFWKACTGGPGYTKVVTDDDPTEAIASLSAEPPGELLACWNTDGASLEGLGDAADDQPRSTHSTAFATAPMLRLGYETEPDPPWMVMDLHTDHLGSVRAVTTNAGFNTTRHDYFPFGDVIPQKQFSYNTHQYTGHERDNETGLDYMLARYYEAGVGRFLSVDPSQKLGRNLSSPQRWNRYTYTLDNPLKFLDADGRDLFLAVGGPTEQNGFGHVAIIHNDTVYSAGSAWSGPKGDWGVSAKSYFGRAKPESGKSQDQSRQTTIIKLKATPEQEAAVVKNLQNGPGDTGKLTNNCAQRSEIALQAGGVLTPQVEIKTTPKGDLGTEKTVLTPEDLQGRVKQEGTEETEETRGTTPDNPASKTTTILNGVKSGSGS